MANPRQSFSENHDDAGGLGCRAQVDAFWDANVFNASGIDEDCGEATEVAKLNAVGNARYQLLSVIGAGAHGTVFEAKDRENNRRVALKVLRRLETSKNRAVRERMALERLSHPSIVAYQDAGMLDDGNPFLAMELVEGSTIDKFVDKNALPWKQVVEHALQICEAVGHAHEVGVLHCDLKPQNILVCRNGTVKITDFGLARFLDDSSAPTLSLNIRGTPAYMAPEQLRSSDKNETTVRTDVFGLGATLYRLLSGNSPRSGKSTWTTFAEIATEQSVPQLNAAKLGIPSELALVIEKAMARAPHDRYRDTVEFAQDLQRVLEFKPVFAKKPSLWKQVGYWARRQPAMAGLAMVTVFAIATVALSVMYAFRAQSRSNQQLAAVVQDALSTIQSMDRVLASLDPGERISGDHRLQILTELRNFYRALHTVEPENQLVHYELAQAEFLVGAYLHDTGARIEASPRLEAALDHFLQLEAQGYKTKKVGYDIFQTHSRLSPIYHLSGTRQQQVQAADAAMAQIRKLCAKYPEDKELSGALCASILAKAILLQGVQEYEAALPHLETVLTLSEEIQQAEGTLPRQWRHKTIACNYLALDYCELGDLDQGLEYAQRAVAWGDKVVAAADLKDPHYWGFVHDRQFARYRLASCWYLHKNYEAALAQLAKAEEDLQLVRSLRPDAEHVAEAEKVNQELKDRIVFEQRESTRFADSGVDRNSIGPSLAP